MYNSESVLNYLKHIIHEQTNIPEETIDFNTGFDEYGINSFMMMEMTGELEKFFNAELSKTLFFEYKNIQELAKYLMNIFEEADYDQKLDLDEINEELFNDSKDNQENDKTVVEDDDNSGIAIIGVSGLFPGANNIDELWENLIQGKDCITEAPEYLVSDESIYCKHGGFIDDVDKFDSLFFKMLPKEARNIDPQIRLFLQETWHAIEDSGYSVSSLKGKKVGVFVGAMWAQYQNYGIEETARGNTTSIESSFASIANRVSYFFDFTGPSMTIDSMCSSSLTAIHLACQSLYSEECDIAIVGGVNLNLHMSKYISICQGRFASAIGRCQSFGENGDGYIPGEGIVSILLKPLNKALSTRDNIYGIIKSTAVNHGGRSNGYTVPNPVAQENVISDAITKAGISPLDVSYIEAHGTGTKLGDPIEINSLSNIYRVKEKNSCAIGSIKSNIGHLEAASGLAGIIKVLLQLKYKKIVPSLHSERLNSYIDFPQTPFYVPQQLEEWKSNGPRRAGISSFGAGGSNAHIIVEEFIQKRDNFVELPEYLFMLSAESQEQVREYVKAYTERLPQVYDLFSMQIIQAIGRVHFRYRVCFVYHDKTELEAKLKDILEDTLSTKISYVHKNLGNFEGVSDLNNLGKAWLEGYEINWEDVFHIKDSYRFSLPYYPFKKEKLWYKEKITKTFDIKLQSDNVYEVIINDNSLFRDHSPYGEYVLPGAFFIDVSLDFLKNVLKSEPAKIEKVIWEKTTSGDTKIIVQVKKSNKLLELIYFAENGETQRICKVQIGVNNNNISKIDLHQECLNNQMDYDQIYGAFEKNGIVYGNSFRNLESIVYGDYGSKAILITKLNSITHILDAAFQAAIPLQINQKCIPVEIGGIDIYKPLAESREIFVKQKYSNNGRNIYDIIIINDSNEVICILTGVVFLAKEEKNKYDLYRAIWKEKILNNISESSDKITYLEINEQQFRDGFKDSEVNNDIKRNHKTLEEGKDIIYRICNDEEIFSQVFEFTKSIILFTHETRIILLGFGSDPKFYKEFYALEGFCNSIERENPNLHFKLILCDENAKISAVEEFEAFSEKVILYRKSKRFIRCKQEIEYSFSDKPNNDTEDGVYVVCGGGKLSKEIIKCLTKSAPKVKIIILRRHPERQIESKQRVIACDLLDIEMLKRVLESIRSENRIKGIIFTSGIIRDSLFINKRKENAYEVINSKIQAIENINMLTQNDMLDCFIILSSMAGVLGNIGQSDYAYANAYLNYFAELRNVAVANGELHGYTTAFSFPLIANGGMKASDGDIKNIEKDTGLRQVPVDLFQRIFSLCDRLPDNLILCYGKKEIYNKIIMGHKEKGKMTNMYSKEEIYSKVLNIFSDETGIPQSEIDIEEIFFAFGVESVNAMSITSRLEDVFSLRLSPAFLYEHNTISKVIDYYVDKKDNFKEGIKHLEFTSEDEDVISDIDNIENTDIAIIGISGRFGQAEDIEALGRLLEAGKSTIEIIPKSRWNNEEYYSKNKAKSGKYYNQYGSFIENYKMFDAAFFNISPEEAAEMDPQQRLFLEEAWKCIEDAGYMVSELSAAKVGVYVGAMWTLYQLYGYESCKRGDFKYANSSLSSIANRVSYEFNFRGPSITLDTMCSSTLTALYLACQDILTKECEYSIVGGVNLSLHPYKYLDLCDKNFLSSDGLCRSFGDGGDGYVPGEGVGAILIKSLRQAIIDHDNIYGVIKGISINHGGYSGGFTIPNADAQADVIVAALKKSHINADEVTYIETHGTGTALGDPIEIAGLEKAYGARNSQCKIGSIKSNIGHLEAAAGIASIAKVLLQFKNKKFYPSINASNLNRNIDWKQSLFVVQQEMEDWMSVGTRTSAISSFGAGGANAHMILQEYDYCIDDNACDKENIILISAKTKNSLQKWCIKFYEYLKMYADGNETIEEIAYTLQIGRERFPYKLAFICQNMQQLMEQLQVYTTTGYAEYICDNSQNNALVNMLRSDDAKSFINNLVSGRKLKELVLLWFSDINIDWKLLYSELPRRISLPTYCFEHKSYWIDDVRVKNVNNSIEGMILELLNISGADSLESTTTLMELGFSSIYALKLLNKINDFYQIHLKLPEINYNPSSSIDDFTSNLVDIVGKAETINREVENRFVESKDNIDYFPQITSRDSEIKTVLLTGATGNLGGSILYELLTDERCKIICIIRGVSREEAIKKLQVALLCYSSSEFNVDEQIKKLEILLGDISEEKMGLDVNTYQRIEKEVDMVIHAAASTNLNGDYDSVKDVNINGTKEVIDFALRTTNKYLVYLSTHMIIGDKWYSESNLLFDEKMLDIGQKFNDLGYQRSKYEAEIMVRAAYKKGLKWNIMRVGNIMGRGSDGAFPLSRGNCLYYDILRTVIDTHVALDTNLLFDITPVDFASKSIVCLSFRDSLYETYHIKNANAITMNNLYGILMDLGIQLKVVKEKEYQKKIGDYTSIFTELVKYNPVFGKTINESSVIDNEYTRTLLANMGIECPDIDQKLISCYLDYCVNQGYISLDNKNKRRREL